MRTILSTTSASITSSFRAPVAALLLSGATTLLPLALVTGAVVTGLGGCTDADIEARTTVQATIVKVADEFATTMSEHSVSAVDKSVESLGRLQSQIDRLDNPSNEQRAAAGLLSAAISQASADVQSETAFRTLRKLQQDRIYASTMADAAATLKSIADSQASISLATDKTQLKEEREEAEASLKQVQDALQQMEGPLAKLKARIEERRGEITALEANVEELRRRAIEAGALAGFPYIEQAATVKGTIRTARSDAAMSELELSSVQPEYDRANLAHEGAKALKSAASSGLDKLQAFENVLTEEAKGASAAAESAKGLAEKALAEIATGSEAVKSTYASIEAALTKAMSTAGSANAGGQAFRNNAKFAKITAQASLAYLYIDQAANAASEAQLHESLAAAGDLFGGATKHADAIAALNTEREELLGKAKEQLVDAIGQIGEPEESDGNSVRGLRNSLNAAMAKIEGREAPKPGAAPAADVWLSGSGFESPEAFTNFLSGKSMDSLSTKKFLGAMRAGTPAGRALAEGLTEVIKAMDPMVAAASAKWGEAAAAALASGSPLPTGQTATPGARTDTRAEFTVQNAMGGTQNMVLVKEGSAWFLEVESLVPGGGAGMSDPAALQGMSMMFKTMAGNLRKTAEAIAARINAGEILSPEQLQQELAKSMMESMMPGGGN
jgi:hypothetical protein